MPAKWMPRRCSRPVNGLRNMNDSGPRASSGSANSWKVDHGNRNPSQTQPHPQAAVQGDPRASLQGMGRPAQLAKWMGPVEATAVEATADVRVGGRYHIRMIVPGDEQTVSGVYREVVGNEKLVSTWAGARRRKARVAVTVDLKRTAITPSGCSCMSSSSMRTRVTVTSMDGRARSRSSTPIWILR